MTITDSHSPKNTFILFYIERLFGHGILTHSSNHIQLKLAKALWSFGHSECNMTLTDSHTSHYIRLFCFTLKDCLDMVP